MQETRNRAAPGGQAKATKASSKAATIDFFDANSGERIDLVQWAGKHGKQFQIATALKARSPSLFEPQSGQSAKRHIRCVNEDAHTQAGADSATFVVDASESSSKSGFVYHCRHGHCDGRDRLLFVKQMLEQGWLGVADLTDPAFLAGPGQVRSTIQFVGGKIATIVDQAETALIAAELGIYQRGAFVVRPGQVSIAVSKEREVSAQRILELGDHALIEALTIAADWEKYDGRSESWVTIDAPLKVAATYKQRVGRWKLPVLTGLINAPTLRDDGSVLADPGYDAATGLLLDCAEVVFPAIPDQPSKDDALAAMATLLGLLDGFSFVGDVDRSVALSAMLTGCIRRSLPTAPLHAFTAPVMGSGKSKLVDTATIMASGRAAAVIAQGKTEEELEKRLGALLLAGDAVIAIDNCEAPLGGEFLCQLLTQAVVRARVLGRSEAPELTANAMVTATGNNLVLVGDMARRALLCRLDPQCERPELRVFDDDPVQVVASNRGKYVVAALTVLRAFHVAGRPKQQDPLGSFAEWSSWVRDALIWLGHADLVETLDAVRASDPKLDAIVAVLIQWWTVLGPARVSGQDIIKHAIQVRDPGGLELTPEEDNAGFREALLQVAGDAGAVNSRRLSKWIGANEDRIVAGFRIRKKGLLRGFMTWALEQVESERVNAA